MSSEQIIKCVFCQGTGNNPHFRGTCPVCKGRGKNEVIGKYMTCSSCRGLGAKRGTTLTCYDCGGIGVIPDTRETFRKAREEIGEAQDEMARERAELTEKPVIKITPSSLARLDSAERAGRQKRKDKEDKWEEEKGEEESSGKTHFCQCCGDKVNDSVAIKICLDCFGKVKEVRTYKDPAALATFGLKEI